MIDVFTIASASQRSAVRVLARSVSEFLPGSRFHWFGGTGIAESRRSPKTANGSGPFARLWDISSLDPASAGGEVEAANGFELALPLAALRLLRESDSDRVLYLAPQVALFSPIDELASPERRDEVVLAPVLLRPEAPREDETPDAELRALRHGVYATHLFAVTRGSFGESFLSWWSDRAREFVPPPDHHRILRPWLNLAPALFPHVRVLRSPRFGVGRDNLETRRVDGSLEDGLVVEGEPLGSFDFTGVDDGRLGEAIRNGRGDQQALTALVAWYRRRRGEEPARSAVPAAGGGG